MDIALLNVKIIFQKNAVIVDEIGNHKNGWADFYTCHATVGGESSTEQVAAGTTVDNADISFSVRFCNAADAITTTDYRILFRGEIYNILSIDHMNYKHKSIKFRCQKVRR